MFLIIKSNIVRDSKFNPGNNTRDNNLCNVGFYPYSILANIHHLKNLLESNGLSNFFNEIKNKNILDIGAADGDLSFFLKDIGFNPTIVDFSNTNYNSLLGASALNTYLGANLDIINTDIDKLNIESIPTKKYGVVFLLGILYHLQNPYHVLRVLKQNSRYIFLSTRIAQYTPDGVYIKDNPLAYLVAPNETNGDSTNYWIFTETGLKRIIERVGFKIKAFMKVGCINNSNPCDDNKDERAFVLIENEDFIE